MYRGYLLPAGCKDLLDALKLKPAPEPKRPSYPSPPQPPLPLPPILRDLVIPAQTSVSDLAGLLGQKPFQIIADLMQFGVYAIVKQTLDFEIISRVTRKYGFIAKRAAAT